MINLKDLRENPQLYKRKYKERFIKNSDKLIDEIILLDMSVRQILEKQQKLQEERNKISKELSVTKDKKSEIFLSLSKKVVGIKVDIDNFEKNILEIKIKINNILHNLPNIHLDDVPVGQDSKSNKEIRKFGKIRDFNFTIKSLISLDNFVASLLILIVMLSALLFSADNKSSIIYLKPSTLALFSKSFNSDI